MLLNVIFQSGMMRDKLGSYIPGMLLMAAVITVGGLWVLTLPFAERMEQRKNKEKMLDDEKDVQ